MGTLDYCLVRKSKGTAIRQSSLLFYCPYCKATLSLRGDSIARHFYLGKCRRKVSVEKAFRLQGKWKRRHWKTQSDLTFSKAEESEFKPNLKEVEVSLYSASPKDFYEACWPGEVGSLCGQGRIELLLTNEEALKETKLQATLLALKLRIPFKREWTVIGRQTTLRRCLLIPVPAERKQEAPKKLPFPPEEFVAEWQSYLFTEEE